MSPRIIKAVWAAFAVTPIAAFLADERDFAALALIAYLIGWVYLRRGFTKDTSGDHLRDLMRTRPVRATGLIVFCVLQLLLFLSPKAGFGLLLLGGVLVLANWSASNSGKELASRLGKIIAVSLSLVVCMATVELGLRLAQWQQPRNGNGWTWGHKVENNALGFRERSFALTKPADSFRVMVLGDSLTWGAGLAESERYTNLLETKLQNDHPEQSIEVLNFALSGAPTVTERDVLRENIARIDPDLVIVGFCVNDPQPESQNYAVELDKFKPLFKAYRSVGKHLGFKKLANFLTVRTDNLLRNCGLVPSADVALDRCYNVNSTEWKAFQEALSDIQDTCQTRGLPSPILVPLLHANGDYNAPDEHLQYLVKWCRQVSQTAAAIGFTVLDMEEEFKREGDRIRFVNPWDGHPDAKCNEVYASVLEPAVEAHLTGHEHVARTNQGTSR